MYPAPFDESERKVIREERPKLKTPPLDLSKVKQMNMQEFDDLEFYKVQNMN